MARMVNGVRPINCLDYTSVMDGIAAMKAAEMATGIGDIAVGQPASDEMARVISNAVEDNAARSLGAGGLDSGPGGQTSKTGGLDYSALRRTSMAKQPF